MNELKLEKIVTLNSSVKVAHLNLELAVANETGISFIYNLEATRYKLRLKESNHDMKQVCELADWLRKSSDIKDNLRSNESEIILFAVDMIKAHDKLDQIKKL